MHFPHQLAFYPSLHRPVYSISVYRLPSLRINWSLQLNQQVWGPARGVTLFCRRRAHSGAYRIQSQPFRRIRHSSISLSHVSLFALITIAIAAGLHQLGSARLQGSCFEPDIPSGSTATMAAGDIPPGRPGNLTSEQEESLRKLWALVLRICNVGEGELDHDLPHIQARSASSELATEKAKKKKPSFFSRRGNIASHTETADSPISEVAAAGNPDFDDKYGQNKQFHETIARQSPESIRDTIWSMVKHDDPDALLLRFLRARKWDVDKALVMLISTMNWRAMEMHVDDDIMKHGEAAAVEAETSGDELSKKLGHGFLAQMRMGKSFLHGSDKEGRPICFVRVRLHRQGEHAEEALERNTVYIIETARMLLRPPIDTAVK